MTEKLPWGDFEELAVVAGELYPSQMMQLRTIKIVAIVLAVIVALTTILGYEAALEWQHIPPGYSPDTIDV